MLRNLLSTLVVLTGTPLILAQEKPAEKPVAKVTYEEHVRPILREHCFSCHSQGRAKSDLALDTYSALKQGGAGGEVVAAGDPDKSRLWQLVAHLDTPEMPPEQDKLPEAKLAVIKNWILGGILENSGSAAKAAIKPTIDLAASAGARKPTGPPPMPEKLSKKPFMVANRTGAVTAIAASPWAPLVAVSGQKQVLLYHAESHDLLGVLPFPEGVPHVLKFSRSGSLLLAGGGRGGASGSVVVYDIKTGNRVFTVGDELDLVLAADINENHTLIALGGPGRVVKIYSTADGSLLHEIRKHTEWIYSIEFSPDGVLLATADRNGGMFVWEADTAREFQNLKGHTAAITDVSWRADSNALASASEDGTVRLWEMNNGTQIKSWNAHGGGAASVEFAHDGRIVSIGRDRQPKFWDQNGTAIKAFEALPDLGLEVAITHDASKIVAGDWTGVVKSWNVADGKVLATLATNPPTLEMLAKAQAEKAAAAKAVAEKAAAELAAVEKQLAAANAAVNAASSGAAAAKAAADKLTAEVAAATKTAAEKTTTAQSAAEKAAKAQAELAKAEGERVEAEKALAAKVAAAKAASDQAVAAKTAAQTSDAEKQAAEKLVVEKNAAIKAANDKLAADTAAAQKAAADKAAAEKLLAEKTATAKAAADAAAQAQAAAQAAAAEAQSSTVPATVAK